MANEDEGRDQEDQEVPGRKEGSGQIPTAKNPRGAGRPTKEWRVFKREQKEFQAWKEAKQAGEFATSATILERVLGLDKRRGAGDRERDSKGFVERTLKRLKLDKLFGDLKFDKVEVLLYKAGGAIAPYVLPVLGGTTALFLGVTGLYIVEEIDKTDTYTRAQWDALDMKVQKSYYMINGVELTDEQRITTAKIIEISGIPAIFKWLIPEVGEPIAVETEIVKATRKVFPQIIHTVLKFQEWFTGTVESVQKFFDIDEFPIFKMQNMFYYHVRKYFKKLRSLFSKVFDTTTTIGEDEDKFTDEIRR